MSARSACHRCGAPYGDGPPPLYCPSCRSKQATGVADLDAYRANPERFALVTEHPAYAAARRWAPRLRARDELVAPIALLLLVSLWAGGMTAVVIVAGSDLAPMFVGVAALMFLFGLVRVIVAARRLWAKREQLIAVIAEDVFESDRGSDPAGVANHTVTLRAADGAERTVLATSALMGVVALTDIGVAYLQGRRLVDFRVLDVMPAPLGPGEPARPPTCATCAAPYTFESRTTCAFCGAALEHPELGEHGARFAALLADPTTRAALDERAVLILPDYTVAVIVLGVAAALLYGLWILRYLFFFFADEWPYGNVILIPIVLFLCFAAIYGRRRLAPHLARRRRELALVVREREDAWASVNGQPVTAHFVTLAGPGGGRIERRADGTVARMIHPGQIGVAHVQGTWLANFKVLE